MEDLGWLRDEHGVTAVVSLQDDADLASKRLRAAELAAACTTLGLAFERFPVADGDPEALAARLPVAAAHLDGLSPAAGASTCIATPATTVRRRSRSPSARAPRPASTTRARWSGPAQLRPYVSALRARYP